MDKSNRKPSRSRRRPGGPRPKTIRPPGQAVLSAPRGAVKGATLQAIQQALQRGEFIYYYQPKVSMVSGRISGAEALLRWRKPDGSMAYPNEFIPVAESTGFITEITIGMLEQLVVDVARVRSVETGLVVSFNASARDFEDHRFVTALFRLVDRGRLAAEEIEVEVTESAALAGKAGLVEQLQQLRNRRVALAMDDFGAGYASIDALSRLPFTSLKLDNGVVRRMHASEKDARIVSSNIRMAHNLGFEVVAEGVETENTYHQLQQAGCSHAQGYWIGRPMPLEEFLAFAASGQSWPESAIGLVHMAALDHIEWRKFIIDKLLLTKRLRLPLSEDDVRHCQIAPTECLLGRWYDGPGRQLEGMAEYSELGRAHIELHACAAHIFELLSADTASAQLASAIRELSEHSTGVIGRLQALEQVVLTQMLANTEASFPGMENR